MTTLGVPRWRWCAERQPTGQCAAHSARKLPPPSSSQFEGGIKAKLSTGKDHLKGEFFRGTTLSWRSHSRRCSSDSRRRGLVTAMLSSREDLVGKTIVVVGLEASGRSAVKLALARGADVVGVDAKPSIRPLEVDPAVASSLRVETGPLNRASLLNASQLVLSPGVSPEQPDVAAAIQAGVPTTSELSFAAEVLPKSIKIAAVTGTNGKSTVTTFAGQLLRHAGVRSFVGGNLGTPLSEAALQCLAFPADDPPFQAAVVEVSSYQLEVPGKFRPKVGVILNLTPDHLERHKTMETYGAMKCRLFAHMDSSDLAVIPQSDSMLRKLLAQSSGGGTRAWLGGLPGIQLDSQARRAFIIVPTTGVRAGLYLSALKAIGPHNAHNAGHAALMALALDLGLDEETIQNAIPELRPLPHRTEIVHKDGQGILWVNDSKATNIDASLIGLKAMGGRKAVVLLGGVAKAGDRGSFGFERLVDCLNSHRAVITFGASGEEIEQELKDAKIAVPCLRTASMGDAVHLARTLVELGDVVILSPACASFDEFRNFEHRGQIFSDLAKMEVA